MAACQPVLHRSLKVPYLDRSTLIRVGLEVDGRIDEVAGAFIQLDPSLQQRTSNLPMMVVDAFGDERIDDLERPRQFRPVAGVAFEVDTNFRNLSETHRPCRSRRSSYSRK